MAVTFKWDVDNIELYDEYNGLEDVVYRVVWKCTATDDSTGTTKDQIGVIDLDLPTTSTGYISIAELPRSQIVEWVKTKVAVTVVETGLNPRQRTVSFMDTTSTTITVAEQAAISAAQNTSSDVTPTPSEG